MILGDAIEHSDRSYTGKIGNRAPFHFTGDPAKKLRIIPHPDDYSTEPGMRVLLYLAVCTLAFAQTDPANRAYEALRARDYDTAIAQFKPPSPPPPTAAPSAKTSPTPT